MKGNLRWKLLLAAGLLPLVVPVLLGFYRMSIESWTMADWLVLYSFIYWPTYLVGLVVIGLALYKLMEKNR